MANREKNVVIEDIVEAEQAGVRPLRPADLAKDLVAADEIEVKARRTLYNRLMRALPAKKAVRYLQLESKIRAVQAYDIAAAIPLMK